MRLIVFFDLPAISAHPGTGVSDEFFAVAIKFKV